MEATKSLVLALGFVMSGLLGSATAHDFSATFAGTFQENRMDLNDDGGLAAWSTGRTDSTFGQVIFQEVVERRLVDSPTGLCSSDQLELELVSATRIDTAADASQIFYQAVESPACFDPATGSVAGTFKTSIVGGTGRYTNATGSVEGNFAGVYFAFDQSPESNQGFGSFNGSFTGTLDGAVPAGDFSFCSETYPCAVGQGDCDTDNECRPGLVCLDEDVGDAYGFHAAVDVCVRP